MRRNFIKSLFCFPLLFLNKGVVDTNEVLMHHGEDKYFFIDSRLIRIEKPNGDQQWFKNGLLHRDNDLPAVIRHDGTQLWFQNGLCHRDNDLPAVIHSDNSRYWFQNGQFQKEILKGVK